MITTRQLREMPVDGTVFVGMDGQDYSYWGMTEQEDGAMAVDLEYADAGACRKVIEVAKEDMDEEHWEI